MISYILYALKILTILYKSLSLVQCEVINPNAMQGGPLLLAVGGGDGAHIYPGRAGAVPLPQHELLHNAIDDEDGCTADSSYDPPRNIGLNTILA